MKRSILVAIFFSFLMLTACSDSYEEADYEDEIEETSTYSSETEEAEYEATEAAATEENSDEVLDNSYGEGARQYLEAIANDIGDRDPGSDGEVQTAEYIQGAFEEIGYSVEISEFTADDEGDTITSTNVIAVKEGASEQVIVVGAHYDDAYEDGTTGADDNASGVAVMLEAARQVFNMETPYTIQFIAFGSEELDLNGSTYYVDSLSDEELGNIVGMVNLDSLIAGDKLYVYGNDGSGSMRDFILEDAEAQSIEIEGKTPEELNNSDGTPCDCADYAAFENAEIPFAYFEATNWNLSPDAMIQVDPQYGDGGEIRHTEYDSVEYLDETFPGRIDEHLSAFTTLLVDLLTQYE
jgi:alkaline phosphatase isozyme conversion protein